VQRWLVPAAALVLLLTLFGAGCGKGRTVIRVGGSTTVQPLAEKWAEAYEAKHPNVDIQVQGGGSTAGIKGCAEGIFDIGAHSRDLKASELERWPELKPHAVARDGVAIIVHPSNPNHVESLTLQEIGEIFATGSNDKWTVISREEGSGTRETFEKKVMRPFGKKISEKCEFLPSNAAVREKVSRTPDAIGYLSLGYVDGAVRTIKVNGIPCTEENVRKGTYPIARTLYLTTRGEAKGEVKKFIEFCLSDEGQRIVEEEGYIRVR